MVKLNAWKKFFVSLCSQYFVHDMKRLYTLFLLLLGTIFTLSAQRLPGRVLDAKTGEAIPFANVFYDGGRGGVQTDAEGRFSIAFRSGARLRVSSVGYEAYATRVKGTDSLIVRLTPADLGIAEAKVVGRKEKYSRKNNPAVELMKKVIAAKKNSDLRQHDYYSVVQYNKLNFALSDVTPRVFEEGQFKRMPFLKNHVERSPETGKLILPLTVDETVTEQIYRKRDNTAKHIVLGQRSDGINELINTGDAINTMLKDAFTEVNLYENNVRLLQYQFISPLSSTDAIRFYRYFLADTTYVEGTKCIEVQFTPNNAQDFGFAGELYVTADSTYRVKKAVMGVPVHTGVNFVELMKIEQSFEELPTGEQVLTKDNMLVVLKVAEGIQKFQVKRTTDYTNFAFDSIPDARFKFRGKTRTLADAQMQEESFWDAHRTERLTQSETQMDLFIRRIQNIRGVKPIIWTAKAFIENFVETSLDPKHPSKLDFGPINTTITGNDVDGLRLRLSAQTTANLSPHWFFRGYGAYGFKDRRWKGMGEVTYSFLGKRYLPREYPVSRLVFSYTNDVMSPSDFHLPTDKDNVFLAAKWTKIDHMMYNENFRLFFEREWEYGLRIKAQLAHDRNEPTANLFYQLVAVGTAVGMNRPLGSAADVAAGFNPAVSNVRDISMSDFSLLLEYQPGATYINTKQRRIRANRNAPIFSISHTVGLKGAWSDYTYNNTEVGIYKRWWVKSWGKIETHLKAGAQWNRVPFPLLCMPWANTSFVKEDGMFNLIKNMEFMNDRYVSFMGSWDLNGKILNRIPLLHRLKWREYIGVNALWGTLTDKNNPYLAQNANATDLFYFPARFNHDVYEQQSRVMDRNRPYVELVAGVHNIFKLLHMQYVRRVTYINEPQSVYGKTQKWGIRFMFRASF